MINTIPKFVGHLEQTLQDVNSVEGILQKNQKKVNNLKTTITIWNRRRG